MFKMLLNAFSKTSDTTKTIPRLTLEQFEKIKPTQTITYGNHALNYSTPNQLTAWRVQTLFSKEPDTIDWINSFAENDILLDVGANVGMYSIFAAVTRKAHIYAFEPESQNYALLNQNIYINNCHENVTAYCLAISDKICFSKLYLSQFDLGTSCHTFGEEIDFNLAKTKSIFSQGAISISLDKLIESNAIPIPDHIKIDVDGLEHKIISGAHNLLSHQKVKSVLVEINSQLNEHNDALNMLKQHGFTWDEQQVLSSRRSSGAFKGVGNYVCVRN